MSHLGPRGLSKYSLSGCNWQALSAAPHILAVADSEMSERPQRLLRGPQRTVQVDKVVVREQVLADVAVRLESSSP
jgi:hypothetical protein